MKAKAEETKKANDQIKDTMKKALEILEKGKAKTEFFDGRPTTRGEMFEKVDIKHILDYAQRLPRMP